MKEMLIEKAEKLLAECKVITVSSVTEEGYPRICVVSHTKADGLATIWFSTGTNSTKTKNFTANPKAGICFFNEKDSVTLTGTMEKVTDQKVKEAMWQDWFIDHYKGGPTDPEYTIFQFTSQEATIWIDYNFQTYKI